jgi:hypothetical protein
METTSEPAWLSAVLTLGPHALWIALIVFLVIYLREPVGELMRRLNRAATPIGTLEMEPGAQEKTGAGAEAAPAITGPLKWIPGSTPPAVVTPLMRPYISGAKARNDEADLALFWMIDYMFEWTYRVIWGSQLDLLRQVDARGTITKADAENFYAQSKSKGNKAQTFDQYITFLTTQGLLAGTADGYAKTALTNQFLMYLTSQSILPGGRPL